MEKKKWSPALMVFWIIVTLLLPVGLIVGPLNLKHGERKSQAALLLVISLVYLLLWTIHFAGMH